VKTPARLGALLSVWSVAALAAEAPKALTDASYPEGALVQQDGLYYAEMTKDRVMRRVGDRNEVVWSEKDCGPTSISTLPKDQLLITCHLGARLAIITRDGRTVEHLTHATDGSEITWPNDSQADRSGGVYLSSSGIFSPKAPATGRVLFVRPDHQVEVVASGIRYANGVALANADTLLVSEHLGRRVLRYHIEKTGALRPMPDFYHFPKLRSGQNVISGPDGIEVDPRGKVYICEYGDGTLWVFDATGKVLEKVKLPTQFVTSSALDAAKGVLYLTGSFNNTILPYVGQVMSLKVPTP
jgi:sugar lactone lactonase YvrE